jgi:2-oxoglutarate dehydrogenase E2 component (dihydrolipoamide succinyltransferase)
MAKYKLLLPKMGESVEEATIIKWTKKPGDYIEADETVMEIATDKVDSDVPSPVSGKLAEQLFKENDVVKVGAVIAIIETAEPEVKEEPVATAFNHIQTQPVVTQSTEEVKPTVQQTTPPAPVYNAPISQSEIKPPVFTEPKKDYSEPVPYTEQLQGKAEDKAGEAAKNSGRFYSPLVKNIAAQEGIGNAELDQIPGTGAEGRLTKDDLLLYVQQKAQFAREPQKAAEPAAPETTTFATEPVVVAPPLITEKPKPEPAAAPVPQPMVQETAENKTPKGVSMSGSDEIIEMDRMRRLIADHMVMSKQTSPHVTSFVEADVTNIVLWRERIKANFEKREGEKITFTPIFIEAVVRAIKDMPMINIQVNGTQIIKKKDINISMATSLPSGNLIVPVIKKADELNLVGLTKAVNDLANRARTNKLKPDDVQGGTFTITNVGSFGNVMGTPIINQPQVAILAVGAIKKKPAVIETLQGDMIGIRHMMFLSLSYDHRVVDGALGG